MKKNIIRIIAFALCVVCLFTLVSCAQPKLNFEKAKENLKAAEYNVVINDDPSTPGVKATLTATNSVLDIVSGDGEYVTITEYENLKAAKLAYEDAKLAIEQQIEDKKLELKIAKYNQKKFGADNEDKIENLEEAIEDLREALKNIGRSGKFVWSGTENGIKATK